MPTRSALKHCADVLGKTGSSTRERSPRTLAECRPDNRKRLRSSPSTSSSSTSASGSSSQTGSSNSSDDSDDDSSSSSDSSGAKAAGGRGCGSRDAIPAVQSNRKRNIISNEDGTRLRKCSPLNRTSSMEDGEVRSPPPPSPVKPEVETKTTSGPREVADIACLSPSKIEAQTSNACSEIPIEMASDAGENGTRNRNRIRIVLGGKLFPVPVSASESLRSISLYSDDEVDCNDDGRSLDRPVPLTVVRVDQGSSKHPTESHAVSKLKDSRKTDDSNSVGLESSPVEQNDVKSAGEVSSSEVQECRQSDGVRVDEGSRSPQPQRHLDERQAPSREDRHKRGSSGRKSQSPGVDRRSRRCENRQTSTGGEQRRTRGESQRTLVSADRADTSRHRTTPERHRRHERTRNEVIRSRSRSKDRRDSRSRSSGRRRHRDETSSSRSRTADYRRTRAEVDERERRGSKRDVTSVSGRRSDQHSGSSSRHDVDRRYRKYEPSTVPYEPQRPRHGDDRSIIL